MAGSNRYVALLRGVNVSGKNLLKMSDLKSFLAAEGFISVSTYLQSGNVLFKGPGDMDCLVCSEHIRNLIKKKFGLDIKVITYSCDELRSIHAQNPFLEDEEDRKKVYFMFLGSEPNQVSEKDFSTGDAGERFAFNDLCIYAHFPNGYGNSKKSSNFFERKLGTWITSRNRNTVENVMRLLEKED